MRRLRGTVLGELVAGAVGSIALTVYAGQRVGAPLVLQVLFGGWVLTPFLLLGVALLWSTRRKPLVARALETVTPVVVFVSLAMYAATALAGSRPKTAVFVLVAPGSWLVIAAAIATMVLLSQGTQKSN